MVNTVNGIELDDGCKQQRGYPLIIYILYVRDMWQPKEVTLRGKHQYRRNQEEEVTKKQYATQTANGYAWSVVALNHLH